MDINMLLKNINTLNKYISASRDILGESKNVKVQFNMSTVLALKKIRSYEIEYFNKYEENGIACAALQYMVDLAPSKTWGILGNEIVNLIQYWLDAIRKHLISHSPHWYTFLKRLLNFIKEIRHKDSSLPNLLVEHTAECLLDLATNDRADALKKYEILHCFNMYCAEANREIRFALRNKFGEYFVKLSTYISSCGHFPCQLSVMETLLRWLVPRQDQTLRSTSAEKWFPSSLYSTDAADVFLKRPWMDFFQDARDFLNIHNKTSNLIVSVICRSLSIGKIVIIPGKDKRASWLDINSTGKCLSMVLEPLTLERCGATNPKTWETLIISEDNTHTAKLDKEFHQLTLSVSTVRPAQAHPSLITITDTSNDMKIVVSAKCDLNELDKALSGVFGDKFQMLVNLESEVTESSENTRDNTTNNSEEDSKFSHPVAVRRGRRSGYMVRSRNPWKSPSTTSTTSLAQLHDKLAALPTYTFDKEAESVCVRPELSSIIEVSETDDRYSLHSGTTFNLFRPYGVCRRDTNKAQNATNSPQRDESKKPNRGLSPAIGRKTAPSCLLVATIGSTDDSVISNTMERLAKNKDFEADNIVDLLVKEALESNHTNPLDSGVNTGENSKTRQEENCEVLENTPCADDFVNVTRKRGCTIVRESTSDESNTEVISGTPFNYVNTRINNINKKSYKGHSRAVKSNVYDAQAVEEFFNLHFAENSVGDTVISPTLAKKINESSSETSENLDERGEVNENPQFQFDNSEVIECLNYIVDKVCDDFDKYTDYSNINKDICNFISDIQEPLETAIEIQENLRKNRLLISRKPDPESTRNVTLKYRTSHNIEKVSKKNTMTKKKTNAVKKYENNVVEEVMVQPKNAEQDISAKTINKRTKTKVNKKLKKNIKSTAEVTELDDIIIEANLEKENVHQNHNEEEKTPIKPDLINDIVPDKDTSLIRKKRKLYSPKDEKINVERSYDDLEAGDSITELKSSKVVTPKSSINFYKEIEKERKKFARKSRMRKSKISETASPKTLKINQTFDKLKETVENNEKIKLVDKTFEIDVYNFTSDSEEEYFKKKKIQTHKRPSTTTIGSLDSAMSTKHGRVTKKVNYTENKSSNEESSKKMSKRKRVLRKRKSNQCNVNVKPVIELEDERMRKAPSEILNTSIIIDNPKEISNAEIEPILSKVPVLESIVDVEPSTKATDEKNKSVKRHKKIELSLKKGNTSKTNSIDVAFKDDRIESPLPSLFVESATACVDENDSVTATMLQKFKKIYQDGFDAYVNETNTTQNLLSDIERVNYSPDYPCAPEIRDDIQTDNCFGTEVFHVKKHFTRSNKLKREMRPKHSHIKDVSLINSQNMDNSVCTSETKDKSEISIATEGINAHGDIDEAPPSPAMIEQKIQPRNLEFEDLEQSMKDFFNNLRNQINGNSNKPYENLDSSCKNAYKKPNGHKKHATDKNKSAKVVVARLSVEEIDKWVSSDKSDSFKISQKIQKQPKQNRASFHEREKSPIVSVSRLSSGEIQKWLPTYSVSEQDDVKAHEKCQENKGIQSLYESHKWFPSRRNSSSDVDLEEINQNKTMKSMIELIFKGNEPLPNTPVSSSNDITTQSKRNKNKGSSQKDNSRVKLTLLFNNTSDLKNSQNENDANYHNDDRTGTCNSLAESKNKAKVDKLDSQKRSSVISPIKIGNFISQIKKSNTPSDDDDYVKRVRNIFAENEKKNCDKKGKIKSNFSQNHLDVLSSPDSTSTKINSSVGTKRKSMTTAAETKKQKVQVIHSATVSESGPSIASVNEWFRKNESNCSRGEIAQLSVIDYVQNVMEKLDVTLTNINGNTSKQFLNLFTDAQKQLDEQKERHRHMYKEAACNMLTQIVKVMDETFCELDKRSQEMDDSFMEQLRSRASKIILEDSKQKQAMVQMMKEDVQAVENYIKKKL